MRRYGMIFAIVGLIGYFYAGDRVQQAGGVSESASVTRMMNTPAGRWGLVQSGAAVMGFAGIILALFTRQ